MTNGVTMNFLNKLFGLNKTEKSTNVKLTDTPYTQSLELKVMLDYEIKNNLYIKEACKPALIKDFNLLNMPDLGNEFLSTEEKKSLNLNVRMKIFKKVVAALTQDGLIIEDNPKDVILNIWHSATNKVNINKELIKVRQLNITQFKVKNVGDARDCDWCNSMNNKLLPTCTDYVALINENCTCSYPRAILIPKIEL